jgi:hypothetical protein
MALLASEDGPTIYDIATAAIALVGLAVSAYSVRRQVKRETRSVRLSLRYAYPMGPITAVVPDTLVTIEVLNDGHRPVEVTAVGFEFRDGRHPLLTLVPLEGPVTFPKTLGDGVSASFHFDLAQMEAAEAGQGQKLHNAYADASGQRYRERFKR